MALPQAKSPELLSKGPESYNGWTVKYTDSKSNGLKDLRAGGRTPDSTRSRVLAQVLQRPTRTNRGWPSLLDRFTSYIEKTDTCWLWRGTATCGYGQIGIGRQPQVRFRAHRLSWLLYFGDIPEGLEVMHTCDQPLCVRPAHLRLGTHAENMADAAQKGRMRGRHIPKAEHVGPPRVSRGGGIRPRHAGGR